MSHELLVQISSLPITQQEAFGKAAAFRLYVMSIQCQKVWDRCIMSQQTSPALAMLTFSSAHLQTGLWKIAGSCPPETTYLQSVALKIAEQEDWETLPSDIGRPSVGLCTGSRNWAAEWEQAASIPRATPCSVFRSWALKAATLALCRPCK